MNPLIDCCLMIRNGSLRDFGIVIRIKLHNIVMNFIIPKRKRKKTANPIFSKVSAKEWILFLFLE